MKQYQCTWDSTDTFDFIRIIGTEYWFICTWLCFPKNKKEHYLPKVYTCYVFVLLCLRVGALFVLKNMAVLRKL